MNKKQLADLRQKYIDNPPDGMTADLVAGMSDSDLLDMDYFLNEDIDDILVNAEDIFSIF